MWLWLHMVLLGFKAVSCIENEIRQGQYFIGEPSDFVATSGETVTLPCRVGNRQGPCQWTRDGLGLGLELDLPAYPRFSMSANSCDLTMFPVLPQDEGVYECQVLAVPGSPPLSSQPALVTVLAEPGQPHIAQATLGDVIEVTVGQEVTLDCESLGGKPAADIHWMYADGTVLSDRVSQQTESMEDNKTFRTASQVSLKALHDMTLTCSATSSAFQTQKKSSLNIRLLHIPQVHLSVDTDTVKEGMTVEILCSAEVYPPISNYMWFINRQEIRGEHDRILRIERISRAYDQVQVMCMGANKVGEDGASTVLTVGYAPQVVTHPTSRVAKTGDTVVFHCTGVGNPPPAYVWISSSTKEVVGFTQNLTVTASPGAEQNYVCRVFSDGFQPADSRPASLRILSRPDILTLSYKETPRGNLIHCSVKSDSKETIIGWLREGIPINVGEDNHEIIFTNDGTFHHSYLVFKSNQTKEAKYSCSASNEAGNVIQDAPLFYRSSHIIYILLPILVAILLVTTLVSIVIVIVRRMQQASVEKMEQAKKLQSAGLEGQPCLGFNNTNHGFVVGGLTPNVSWHNFNTISSVMAQAVSSEQPGQH